MCIAGYCPHFSFNVSEGSDRGLVVKVLDSGLYGRGFDPHTERGSLLKLGQFHLPPYHLFKRSYFNVSYRRCKSKSKSKTSLLATRKSWIYSNYSQ